MYDGSAKIKTQLRLIYNENCKFNNFVQIYMQIISQLSFSVMH